MLRKEYIRNWEKNNPEKKHRYNVIATWKYRGIIDNDFNSLYEYFLKETHCWICDKEYKKRSDKVLDHCHETGEPRYIVCRGCNSYLLSALKHNSKGQFTT